MELWTESDNYFGPCWPATYVFLTQNRDSDTLTRSNFDCALERLKELPEFEEKDGELTSRIAVRASHWACGWVEWIAIHADDVEGIALAEKIESDLEDYPVIDENHFIELQENEATVVWRDCYQNAERVKYIREYRSQFEFKDFTELMAVARGKYFNGYASELL